MKNLLLIWLCLAGFSSLGQKYTISGYLKDAQSGESLIGASVYNPATFQGTTTNYYGYFSLTLPAQEEVTLTFSYVGYQSQTLTVPLTQDRVMNIQLVGQVLEEVVVEADAFTEPIQESTRMSSINVPIQQIKRMPAFFGEVDLLKVIQLLPGVQSGTEGSSGIYVRGGGPDQNLILLDGVPVYNASHLFGFFSVFNADAINNVELIKGGFPARYGGRLSSVIDISMKEGNNKEWKGEGAIGLIASKLTVEGPLKKDKSSLIVSARRTYIDVLTRPLIKMQSDGEVVAGYYFYDINTKLNYRFSDRDRLYFSVYTGDDKAYARNDYSIFNPNSSDEYRDEFGLRWGNITSALRWNHVLTPKLFSNVTATYSRYRFNIYNEYQEVINGQKDIYLSQYLSGIRDYALKVDFDYLPNPNHFIKFGSNIIDHRFNPGAANLKATDVIDTVISTGSIYALELANYIEDDIKIGSMLKVNAGLHYSAFFVEDEVYHSLQPRVAARLLLPADFSIKGSYAQMTQYIHLLTNSGIGLPTDLWVPATNNIKPQQSHQVAFGVAKMLDKRYEFSAEAYYKTMENIIEYKEGAGFTEPGRDWQTLVEVGDGLSYGAELFLQKRSGPLTGWLGYTWSKTTRQFDAINFGKAFPYKYDRRHDVSVTGTYALSNVVDFSLVWVYGTGNAISLPVATYPGPSMQGGYYGYAGYEINHYEGRNGFRMRAYHRMDVSFSFKKERKWGEQKWVFAIYNAYNRRNPFFLTTGYDQRGNKKFVQYSLFPFLPSVSYQFSF
ncbi:TonB-dependent receptor [Cytophagales bacterium LB-30]|uniref:TonB-dependent receptor n=1 Tax=Shiella aurantiaca TaxID=3058365 RepID=A0ABT8F1T9_9BACT|nr:TonB-dependent receptor [Shiella aurantiaca]MDN4164407.1 TonB-dependent receptor [Shiella aurantiaca]